MSRAGTKNDKTQLCENDTINGDDLGCCPPTGYQSPPRLLDVSPKDLGT